MEIVLIGLFTALIMGAGVGARQLWRAAHAQLGGEDDEAIIARLQAQGQVRDGEVAVIVREAGRRELVWCANIPLRKVRLELTGFTHSSGLEGLDPLLSKGSARLDQARLSGGAQALLELVDPALDEEQCAILYLRSTPVRLLRITDTQSAVHLGADHLRAGDVEGLRRVGMVLDRVREVLGRLDARAPTPELLGRVIARGQDSATAALKQQAIEALVLWWPEHALTQRAIEDVRARQDDRELLALMRAAPDLLLDTLTEDALMRAMALGLSHDQLTPAQLWATVDRRMGLDAFLLANPTRAVLEAVIRAAAARGLPEHAWQVIRPRLERSAGSQRAWWLSVLAEVDTTRGEWATHQALLDVMMQPPADASPAVEQAHAEGASRLICAAPERLDASALEPLLLRWLSAASPNAALALLPAVEAIGGAQSIARLKRISSHVSTPGALVRGCLHVQQALIEKVRARPERGGLSLSEAPESHGALTLAIEGGDLTLATTDAPPQKDDM